MVALAAVLLRGGRVDAEILTDHVGFGALGVTGPVHAIFVGRTGDSTPTTMLEAGVRVDAAVVAQDLQVGTVDLAHAIFADLIVEAGLAAATTVADVQISADTDTVTIDLLGVGTASTIIRGFALREIGIGLTAAKHCNHREQEEPHMFWT